METVAPIALLGLVVFTLTNLVRFARGKDWNGVATIATTWLVGFVAALLFANSTVGEAIVIPGMDEPLGLMSVVDLFLVALLVSSTAQGINEFRGAIDNSTSTAKPHLASGEIHDRVA